MSVKSKLLALEKLIAATHRSDLDPRLTHWKSLDDNDRDTYLEQFTEDELVSLYVSMLRESDNRRGDPEYAAYLTTLSDSEIIKLTSPIT
jgi:hypothetical protein